MMRPSTFFFLTRRGVRNLGKHWAMTIACIASLSVCMTLNIFASLAGWKKFARSLMQRKSSSLKLFF